MRWLLAGFLALAFFLPQRAAAQIETDIRITAPASGDTLQGLINITGTSAADDFASSELSFVYASDSAFTWFLIYQTDQPVTDGLLAVWDTSLVTDGDYNLRLRVTLQDGTILESLVTGLRVRNQTPTETPTLAPTSTPDFDRSAVSTPLPPTPMPAPTSTHLPTPTLLPPNPATVSDSEIYAFLARAILVTLLTFLVVALVLRVRRA